MCRPYKRAGQFPVVTLIRPLRGHLSLPPLAFGHFPLTEGIGPLEGGRLAGGHMGPPLRRETAPERWFGKARRSDGTAPETNFAHAGPLWGRTELHPGTPALRAGNFAEHLRRGPRKRGTGGKANMSAERSS